ncbi:MAG: hypothetical protein QOF68_555 [Gaiellales bacterium]|jgi:hypothetical protein|nr:hypothetical protein [Gaiellales bacterium]
MTTAVHHRERLEDVRRRTADARDRIAKAKRERAVAIEAWDGRDPNSEPARRAHLATQALQEAERDLDFARDEESFVLQQVAGLSGTMRQESFLSNPTALGQLEQLAHSSMPIGSVSLGVGMDQAELLQRIDAGDWGAPPKLAAAGDVTVGDSPARRGAYRGVVPQLRRPLRLLDLIPSAPGDGSGFDYTQETGSFDTAPETVEGAMKPAAEVGFVDAEVKFRTIPHRVKIPRQQLADVPSLSVIENRLVYGVLRRVENQIVAGDGTGENLRGVLNTVGIGTVAFDAGVPLGELPLAGIVDVLLSDAEPTGVVLHPTDWRTMITAKAEGSGEYVGNGPFGTGARTLWDLPTVPSTAIAPGTALVGDWSQATLFVREGAKVRVSDSDQDDFTRNRVTLLGEGRFGLAVWQPAAFAMVDLAA